MAYAAELWDFQPALRLGVTSATIYYWPKRNSSGNVATGGTPSVTIYSPHTDTVLAGPSNATVDTSNTYAYLSANLNISDTDTFPADENYRAVWSYIISGEIGKTRRATVLFDIAKEPYEPIVSLNNLLEEEVDIGGILERQAQVLTDSRTAEQHASVLAWKAWGDVREWFRSDLAPQGKILARSIMDIHAVNRVVIAQTMHRAYKAEGGHEDTEAATRAREWGAKAYAMFKSMPPLRYDSDNDGIPDDDIQHPGAYTPRRSWT